jgi:pimeloyl-ACP methyl ester carboxylesterase
LFLIKEIKIGENEKISIVGHSLGGYIAAQFAIENRKMMEKLVLIEKVRFIYNYNDIFLFFSNFPLIIYRKVLTKADNIIIIPSRHFYCIIPVNKFLYMDFLFLLGGISFI